MPLSLPAGAGHFDHHQLERHFDVLVLVSGKMTQTKANGEIVRDVADKMSVMFPLVLKRTLCPLAPSQNQSDKMAG